MSPRYASFYFISIIAPGEQRAFWSARGLPTEPEGFFTASLAAYSMRTGLPLDGQYVDAVGAAHNASQARALRAGVTLPAAPRDEATCVIQVRSRDASFSDDCGGMQPGEFTKMVNSPSNTRMALVRHSSISVLTSGPFPNSLPLLANCTCMMAAPA